MPLVQSGVTAAREAGTAGMADTEAFLGRSGAANSSFAPAILGNAAMAENQAISQVPGQVGAEMLSMMPQVVGLTGTGFGGLGTAASTNTTTATSGLTNFLNNVFNTGATSTFGQFGGVNVGSSQSSGSSFDLGTLLGPLEAFLMGG